MPEKVKLKDIASTLGVSVVTVSNALAGRRGVGEAMRRQILARAEALGYSCEKNAEAAPGSIAIGVLVSERYIREGYSYYWEMYQQVAHLASNMGGFTMIEIVTAGEEAEMALPLALTCGENEGLIAIGPFEITYLKKLLRHADIPVVLLDYYDMTLGCDAVLRENYYGMYCVTDYLLVKGHRNILFVGSMDAGSAELDRYLGFLRGMREAGISTDEEQIVKTVPLEGGGVELSLPSSMPTAFAVADDRAACLLMDHLAKAGIRVPEEVSVVSFGDDLFGSAYEDILTTYHVDMEKMADTAVALLKERMGGSRHGRGAHFVDGWLMERASVKER